MNNTLGITIKQCRELAGLSIRELAKLAEINSTDVSKLEKNKILKPSVKMLLALSKVLNINLFAVYLEGSEKYVLYKPIIESCSNLNQEQIQEVIQFINTLKDSNQL